ncbi:MAG: LicD family protein [Ruminococcaceae bacterium]|nr:LicD family protein [Oscillospiraceae bacterium]
MSELDLQRLKEVEFNILKAFISICNKHSLSYFLIGGTALGAVRHKGFIPWDDDIDVGMPREDYEKFLAIAQSELPDELFLQTPETDPEYLQCFAKIRNSKTTFRETVVKHRSINHGMFIDIFPLDGCVNYTRHRRKTKLLQIRISADLALKRSFVRRALILLSKIRYPSLTKAKRKLTALWKAHPYASSEYIANFGGAWGKKEVVPRTFFGKGTEGTFEGLTVRLPEKADEYLTAVYGDYMTPPPPEKRIAHHHCDVIDPDTSYMDYMEAPL